MVSCECWRAAEKKFKNVTEFGLFGMRINCRFFSFCKQTDVKENLGSRFSRSAQNGLGCVFESTSCQIEREGERIVFRSKEQQLVSVEDT